MHKYQIRDFSDFFRLRHNFSSNGVIVYTPLRTALLAGSTPLQLDSFARLKSYSLWDRRTTACRITAILDGTVLVTFMASTANQPAKPPVSNRARLAVLAVVLGTVLIGAYPIGRQLWAAWHFRAAESALEKKDFAEAHRRFVQAMEVWQSSGETAFLAARAARRSGDLDAAQKLIADAQRLDWVPEALALERALIQAQSGNYRSVLSYLLTCVRRSHPDSILILEVLTPLLTQSYDVGPALECAGLWIAADPNNPRPYLLHGEISERMRLPHEAIAMYRKALEHAPQLLEGHFRLGIVLLARKLPVEALPHLETTYTRRSELPAADKPYAVIAYAQCLHELGRDPEARKLLAELPSGVDEDYRVPSLLGLIELDEGNFDKAEPLLRRAAAAKPFEPLPLSNLERCLRLNQKAAEADELKKRIDRIDADMKELNELMVKIRRDAPDPELRRQVAIRLMRNGNEEQARRWLESALQQNPMHGPSHDTLADYYETTGDLTRAAEHRKRAKELKR